VKFNDLGKQWESIRENCIPRIDKMGFDGNYIGGDLMEEFERKFAEYIGSDYAVGVSNGTDGLKLALQSLDLDERDVVIMPANTFIADYIAVKHLPTTSKPKIILIDHDDNFCIDVNHLESCLKKCESYRKIVVIAVHLYGHACDMDRIMKMKKENFFFLIEDCSQSHGTTYNGAMMGLFGDLPVFSLYPGKNLGALGDAGIVMTDIKHLANKIKALRNYGSVEKYKHDVIGHNNRLDAIQCIFLIEKLSKLDEWNESKRRIAKKYLTEIKSNKVILPAVDDKCNHSWHIFCVIANGCNRATVMDHLKNNGIPSLIHYPIPLFRTGVWESSDEIYMPEGMSITKTEKLSSQILSLPIHPFMTDEEVTHIIKTLNEL